MILQRARPPLMETPFEVFDKGVFTPMINHMCSGTTVIPTDIDIGKFSLTVARPCESNIVAVFERYTSRIAESSITRSEPVLRQLAWRLPASRTGRAMGKWRHG
jgi:hypothetical protein